MKKLLLLISIIFIAILSHAQPPKDSTKLTDSLAKIKMKAAQDSAEKVMLAKATYPVIKSAKWSGVLPVEGINEKPDLSHRFKILLEVTHGIKDSIEAKEVNDILAEVGRQVNIHVAAGVPLKNIDMVVVGHGGVLRSFFTNEAYQKKYKVDNPNIALFNELRSAGVTFIACGQAMNFLNIEKSQLLPWVKVALSAQSVITDYQLRGYIHRPLKDDN